MANVFNVPGVPPLSSFLSGGLSLLTTDASPAAIAAQATLEWGIFLNGLPVVIPVNPLTPALQAVSIASLALTSPAAGALVPFGTALAVFPVTASFVDVDFKKDFEISDYPIEQGGFQSYDKVSLPFTFRVRLASSGNAAVQQAFQNTMETMAEDTSGLYEVVTPSVIYENCTVAHIDYARSSRNGVSLLVYDVWFLELRITATATLQDTQNPANAGQQNTGIVQPQTPSTQVTSQVDSVGAPF